MNLRTITHITIIINILIALAQLFLTINSLIHRYNAYIFGHQIPSYIINILLLLGYVCLLISFFRLK